MSRPSFKPNEAKRTVVLGVVHGLRLIYSFYCGLWAIVRIRLLVMIGDVVFPQGTINKINDYSIMIVHPE